MSHCHKMEVKVRSTFKKKNHLDIGPKDKQEEKKARIEENDDPLKTLKEQSRRQDKATKPVEEMISGSREWLTKTREVVENKDRIQHGDLTKKESLDFGESSFSGKPRVKAGTGVGQRWKWRKAVADRTFKAFEDEEKRIWTTA